MIKILSSSLALLFLLFPGLVLAADSMGYGTASGGASGPTVTVTTAAELTQYALDERPLIIQVKGTITGVYARVRSNTTIVGVGPGKPTIVGTLYVTQGDQNVIFRDLYITNPAGVRTGDGDGISITNGRNIWVDHCTFVDCADGSLDITHGSDRVTVSWCKFFYKEQEKHRFVMLAQGLDEKERKRQNKKGKLRLTLHHNWWASRSDQRMPAARNADIHMFNNYFNCADNSYSTNARDKAEILSERNVYDRIKNPIFTEDGGKIKTRSNVYDNCTGKIARGDDKVFKPDYAYELDETDDVPKKVRGGAGCRIGG